MTTATRRTEQVFGSQLKTGDVILVCGYEAWMRKVDAAVWAKAQMSVHDLPDCPTRDWFEDGMTPKAAASKAIRMAEGEDE